MKLSTETLDLLKNFSILHQSIKIDPGSTISTRSGNKAILAIAQIPETFKDVLAIYNLPQFLNVFTMFQDPTLDLSNGRQAQIKDGKTTVKYTFAEPALIGGAPKMLQEATSITDFEITAQRLQQLLKGAGVMGLPEIYIKGDGTNLYIGATDTYNSATNTYDYEIGQTSKTFSTTIKIENLKLLMRDYRVSITDRYAKFNTIDDQSTKVTYYIALDHQSNF